MGTYRIDRSYDWNYRHGPSYTGPFPDVPETPLKDFLGYPVRSRIGVAAGLLLNSAWVQFYARFGFDILTYKTVRIKDRKCYALPNWVFVESSGSLEPGRSPETLVRLRRRPKKPASVTSSVSFGMPSRDPKVWTADVARARKALRKGQVLLVSVVASPESGDSPSRMVDEFGQLTELASESGAQVVEANLSCPNVCSAEGSVYLDPDLSRKVAQRMRQAAGTTPILVKAGLFEDDSQIRQFLRAVDGIVDGVLLVNGISRRVVNPDGTPAFGSGREVSGVLGRSIHEPCVRNVRAAVETVRQDSLSLKILAVGGVLSEEDARRYFESGTAAVLMGGGPMLDPHVAVRFKMAHPEW